jgi:Glycosyl hydrolase family 10
VRTFVNNATDQVPTDSLSQFAQPFEYSELLKAALAVPECISFTVWGFTDSDSWVPGVFTGAGDRGPGDTRVTYRPFGLKSFVRTAGGFSFLVSCSQAQGGKVGLVGGTVGGRIAGDVVGN